MNTEKTLGRKPTLGEAIDYYTREDFLQFLLDTCRTRRVVMVIPEKLHWEPSWGRNEVVGEDVEQLYQYILDKRLDYLGNGFIGEPFVLHSTLAPALERVFSAGRVDIVKQGKHTYTDWHLWKINHDKLKNTKPTPIKR